jgi:hypothetical protein
VISSSQRPLPHNTQHSQQTNIHASGDIRTQDLSWGAAADLRLRPRGHWDRKKEPMKEDKQQTVITITFFQLFNLNFSKNIGEIPFQALTAVTFLFEKLESTYQSTRSYIKEE